jgi:hypothetical protein
MITRLLLLRRKGYGVPRMGCAATYARIIILPMHIACGAVDTG